MNLSLSELKFTVHKPVFFYKNTNYFYTKSIYETITTYNFCFVVIIFQEKLFMHRSIPILISQKEDPH